MKFNEKKAAQVAAFFIFNAGGTIDILKLMKLMYLAERESFTKFGEPIIGDKLFSMDHGPVLSSTLDHINNMIESEADGWESWISDRENHLLSLRKPGDPTRELTQLSDADIEILNKVWAERGHLTGSQLRNLTHQICSEWEDPDHSATLIPYSRLLKCVGYEPEVAEELEQRIFEQRRLESIIDRVG